ncbi:MAG: hypothetical protein GX298_05475 [Planctomycetes bacterium]|jgi:hypothetical protein|nr:hypothetical protein [Planctomycetota bacterium]
MYRKKRNTETLLAQIGEIFKVRLPEVTLVVVFQTGLMVLLDRVMVRSGLHSSQPPAMPNWAMFVLGLGCMSLAIVWQMLYLGFLRTSATDGAAPQEPSTLLKTGRPYFWRILGVQIVIGLATWVIVGVLILLIAALSGRQLDALPDWLMTLLPIIAIVLLIKPVFLIPSFILVLDYKANDAFQTMRQVRLSNLGVLPGLYGLGLAALAGMGFLVSLAPQAGAMYYIAQAAGHLIQSLIFLTLMLATVLFIALETEKR